LFVWSFKNTTFAGVLPYLILSKKSSPKVIPFMIYFKNFIQKNRLIFCIVLIFSLSANAQTFIGTVLSAETKTVLTNLSIQIPELHLSANSDLNGIFTFKNLPKSSFKIQISGVGLETLIQNIDTKTTLNDTFYLAESHIDLHEIVVSVPNGQLSSENIVNIETQKIAALRTSAPLSLMEALTNVQGVEQITTGAGIGKPVIRGLSGSRIVTYAQGIRVENQQFGEEHGLGVNDVGIESVEVIKGAASLLYGADALGGVIFFTDEKYAPLNKIQGSVGSRFMTNTSGMQTNGGLKINKNNIKLNVFGAYNAHSDYTAGKSAPELRVLNTRFDEGALKASLGYTYKNWVGNVRYSYLQNNFGISEGAIVNPTNIKLGFLPKQNIVHQSLSVENNFYFGKGKLNTILGFSKNDRKEFENTPDTAALHLDLATFTYNIKYAQAFLSKKLNFIAGIQGLTQKNTNKGAEYLIPDAMMHDFGAYSVLNYTINPKIDLQGGLRYDMRNLTTIEYTEEDTHIHAGGAHEHTGKIFPAITRNYMNINASLGGVYKLNKVKLRANAATAFRPPNLSELLSNGAHKGAIRYEKGNTNLKSEQGLQADFSATYESTHFSFALNPFYNTIQNFIYLAPTDSIYDGLKVYEYRQTNANLYGAEATAHLHPHALHWLHLQTSFTSVTAADAQNNALPMIPANKIQSNIKIELDNKRKENGIENGWCKSLFVEHIYRFSQQRIAEYELATPDYTVFNAGINAEYATENLRFMFEIGAKNLFDTQYTDHLSRFRATNTSNMGRNLFFGVNVKF
jgi:iron complex outermembrane recepter protein